MGEGGQSRETEPETRREGICLLQRIGIWCTINSESVTARMVHDAETKRHDQKKRKNPESGKQGITMDAVTILKEDIKESASPYHAGERAVRRLKDAGFRELKQSEPWTIERGGAYVVSCFGTSVVAFTVGSGFRAGGELRAAAAHLDSPCLRIKPSPETNAAGCCKLNIEPYGSMIYAS